MSTYIAIPFIIIYNLSQPFAHCVNNQLVKRLSIRKSWRVDDRLMGKLKEKVPFLTYVYLEMEYPVYCDLYSLQISLGYLAITDRNLIPIRIALEKMWLTINKNISPSFVNKRFGKNGIVVCNYYLFKKHESWQKGFSSSPSLGKARPWNPLILLLEIRCLEVINAVLISF